MNERTTVDLYRRLADRKKELEQARALLGYALHLRQYGENAPGGNETWGAFDARAEEFLRFGRAVEPQDGYSPVRVPENTGKHPAESTHTGINADAQRPGLDHTGHQHPSTDLAVLWCEDMQHAVKGWADLAYEMWALLYSCEPGNIYEVDGICAFADRKDHLRARLHAVLHDTAGSWCDPIPDEPGPKRDAWLTARGWDSYEQWSNRGN